MVALLERPTSLNGSAWVELLAPLTHVQSRKELESVLQVIADRYNRLESASQKELTLQELVKRNKTLVRAARQALQIKAGLFGPEAHEQISSTLDSLSSYDGWLLSLQPGAVVTVTHLLAKIGQPLSYAIIVINAVRIILHDLTTDWTAESVPVLCEAADDFMTCVEDAFLELEMPPKDLSGAIPMKAVIG